MNNSECLKVLAVLQAAYPHAFKGMTRPQAEAMQALWAETFARDHYEEVAAAVKAIIASDPSEWPPAIGKVRQVMIARRPQDGRTELEAWDLVRKALRNGTYGAEAEYAKLPEDVQRAVGSPAQIRAWAAAPEEETETVMQSNFLRSYRAVQEQIKQEERYGKIDYAKLSRNVDQVREIGQRGDD